MVEKKSKKKIILIVAIVLILIYPMMLMFSVARFYIGARNTPETAKVYAEEKYNLEMNIVSNYYYFFPEPQCGVILSPKDIPDFTFEVMMNHYNLEEVWYDNYYDSYFRYLVVNYIKEDIDKIFGADVGVSLGGYGSIAEVEKYFYPTMELEEMAQYYNDFTVVIELNKLFNEDDLEKDVEKIFETIIYLDEGMINPNEMIIEYQRNSENYREVFGFYNINEIHSVDDVKAIMLEDLKW